MARVHVHRIVEQFPFAVGGEAVERDRRLGDREVDLFAAVHPGTVAQGAVLDVEGVLGEVRPTEGVLFGGRYAHHEAVQEHQTVDGGEHYVIGRLVVSERGDGEGEVESCALKCCRTTKNEKCMEQVLLLIRTNAKVCLY